MNRSRFLSTLTSAAFAALEGAYIDPTPRERRVLHLAVEASVDAALRTVHAARDAHRLRFEPPVRVLAAAVHAALASPSPIARARVLAALPAVDSLLIPTGPPPVTPGPEELDLADVAP